MDQKVCTFNVNYLPLCFGYMRTFEMLFENLHLHSFYYVVQINEIILDSYSQHSQPEFCIKINRLMAAVCWL